MKIHKISAALLCLFLTFVTVAGVSAVDLPVGPDPIPSPVPEMSIENGQQEFQDDAAQEGDTDTVVTQEVLDSINNNPITVPESAAVESAASADEIPNDTAETDTSIAGSNGAPLESQEQQLSEMATAATTTSSNFVVEPINSVYNVYNNNNDYVSRASGALSYDKNILSLPGVNGLDLDLSISYNSGDAVISTNAFQHASERIRKINYNSFAVGWRFAFPSIIKSTIKQNFGYARETQLLFPDGSSYKIENDMEYLSEDRELELQAYYLSDLTLIHKANPNTYILTHKDGLVYVFDGVYGNILQIKDRFDNQINFSYTQFDYFRGSFIDYIFNPSYYQATLNALTQITDSVGRVITIDYEINKTNKGTEVKEIRIKMNNTVYATIQLKRVPTYQGDTDIVTQITDGEGNVTKFEYEEKIAHIYRRNLDAPSNPSYTVNGSVFALKTLSLPTGGQVHYEYTKARRGYSYYVPNVTIRDWYEVYKVSKVSDSTGFTRKYEYVNDMSNYTNSPGLGGYYACLMHENNATTITTFDLRHNLIREQTYDSTDAINRYIAGHGQTKWKALIGDDMYHMGYITIEGFSITSASPYTFFYKQNLNTGETTMLTPFQDPLPDTAHLKSYGNYIFLFYKTGKSEQYKLVAKSYNTQTDTWADAGEIALDWYADDWIYLDNMYYTDGVFYSYGRPSLQTLHHAVYNPALSDINSRWTIKANASVAIEDSTFKHCVSLGSKVYYINTDNRGDYIIEYDLTSDKATRKRFADLHTSGEVWGFSSGGSTYCANGDSIIEFDYEKGEIVNTYSLPNSGKCSDFYAQVGTNNRIYLIKKTPDDTGLCPVYRFNASIADAYLLIEPPRTTDNGPVLFSGNNCLYLCGDGTEKIDLTASRSAIVSVHKYDELKQRIETKTIYDSSQIFTDTYTRDNKGNLLSTTDKLGYTTQTEYDATYSLPTKVTRWAGTADAQETTYTLSADKKKVTTVTAAYDDRTQTTTYTYGDSAHPGNVTREVLQETRNGTTKTIRTTANEYGAAYGYAYLTKQTISGVQTNSADFAYGPAADIVTTFTYDMATGQVASSTDALGRTTTYEYNALGWPTRTEYPDGTVETRTYVQNPDTQVNTITVAFGDGYAARSYYDGIGRLVRECDVNLSNGMETELATYTYDGNRVSEVEDANGSKTAYAYDCFGRLTRTGVSHPSTSQVYVTEMVYEDLAITTYTDGIRRSVVYYDPLWRPFLSMVGPDITETTYDYMGNVISVKDGRQKTTTYTYNDLGQLTAVTDALGQVTAYDYDALGNVTKLTTPGGSEQHSEYDTLGRLVKQTDALGQSAHYAYDAAGNIIATRDRNGQDTTFAYKPGTNYVSQKAVGGDTASYTYNEFGSVLTMSDAGGTTSYAYTYNNRLQRVTAPDGKTATYTYDALGNVTGVTDYGGTHTGYTYGLGNRLESVKRAGVSEHYLYNTDGTVSEIVYPGEGRSEFTYDESQRVTAVTNRLWDGTALNAYSYVYDAIGNVLQKTDNGQTTAYTYDAIGRLTKETGPDGRETSWTFDANGNRATQTVTHPSQTSYAFVQDGTTYTLDSVSTDETVYAYDANNRLLTERRLVGGTGSEYTGMVETVRQYTYDANGNVLTAQTGGQVDESVVHYGYDAWGKPAQYTAADGAVTTYAYNAAGERVSKTHGGVTTKFYWDRGYIVNEAVGGDITASNVLGAGGVFARESGGVTEVLFKNAHGDVTAKVAGGVVTGTYDYDAYGNQASPSSADTNPFRYCGEYTDLSSGLIYLRNRYYDPSIGRFISEDPIKDGLNWYVYANNNPIMFFDPFGLAPTTKEAAEMADHIYHWDQNNDKKDRIVSGWRLIDVWWGRESMKMGIYIRNSDDWENPSEYVIVFKGTDNLQNWVNNAEAYLSSKSADMWDAINYSKGFVGSHSQEITFVGHSKGGGEAIAAATATNKNAITFNAANFNFSKYGLTETNKSGIKNYYVDGEVLSAAIGYARFGTTQPLLPTQYWTVDWSIFGREIKIPAPIKNHYMDAVKRAL